MEYLDIRLLNPVLSAPSAIHRKRNLKEVTYESVLENIRLLEAQSVAP